MLIFSIILFSTLVAFRTPISTDDEDLVIATEVEDKDEYDTVMAELEALERQVESELDEDDVIAWTPVLGIVARSAAAVRATVAHARAAVALTRAATHHTPRIVEAARAAGGTIQLITTIFGIAKVHKISETEYYKKMSEFHLFLLG